MMRVVKGCPSIDNVYKVFLFWRLINSGYDDIIEDFIWF